MAVVSAPRVAITMRKGAGADLDALVRDGLNILNQRMDKLMAEFKDIGTPFYQTYFDARIIVDLGGKAEPEPEPEPEPPGP